LLYEFSIGNDLRVVSWMRSSTSRRWMAALSMRSVVTARLVLVAHGLLDIVFDFSPRLIAQGTDENQGRVPAAAAGAGGRGLFRRMSFFSSRLRAAAALRLRISVGFS
jgi:hypothetical protein